MKIPLFPLFPLFGVLCWDHLDAAGTSGLAGLFPQTALSCRGSGGFDSGPVVVTCHRGAQCLL